MDENKLLPHNLEAEKAVLGAALIKPEVVPRIIEILPDVKYFYNQANRKIYSVILTIFQENPTGVDAITVTNTLQNKNEMELVGGWNYVSELVDNVVAISNIDYYAGIVKDKFLLRDLINKSNDIKSLCIKEEEETASIVEQAEKMIMEVGEETIREGFVGVNQILGDVLSEIETLSKNKNRIPGVKSGYTKLDNITSGFQKSDLIIVAGRPSMGKTSFALNIAKNAAVDCDVPVAIFSLEMSREQLVQRFLTSSAKIGADKIRTGYGLTEKDWIHLTTKASELSEKEIYIDDSYNVSVLDMLTKTRRLKAEKDIGLVIVDYLQLMHSKGRTENRQQEISTITRALKGMAKDLKIPVIVLSQLSRQVEMRQDKRPQLSDLRESGAIEQDADLVMFVYRDERYNENSELKGIAEIIIGKHRNGQLGNIKLVFLDKYMAFENYAYEEDMAYGYE